MTGTLVTLAHRIADARRGSDDAPWLPYLPLWLSLAGGGIAGALGLLRSANATLWSVAAVCVALVALTRRRAGRRDKFAR